MEKAIRDLSVNINFDKKYTSNWKMKKEFSLSKELLATSQEWESDKGDYIVATKGAPEAIIDLCHMNNNKSKEILDKVSKMANEGLRVIGVAKSKIKRSEVKKQHDFDFEFVGLIGFEDPIRPEVVSAVKECYTAGIKIVMITGDYPITAKNIASQIGLHEGEIITGSDLAKMSESELKKKISKVTIFARVVPEQKLMIVNAFKSNHEIVVMTGDGVNDAPALKSANIGIAMGYRGTDVAREASSMVLLDDNFLSIVEGIKTGRRIFDNIRKAMGYILAVHLPIAGITVLSVLFGWPLILLPAHIVFLELLIDPACSIVFEAEKPEKNIMRRRPRDTKEKIFDQKTIKLGILQGVGTLIVVILLFKLALYLNMSEGHARALSFSTLIFANLGMILTNLSWSQSIVSNLKSESKSLWTILTGGLVFLFAVIYVPFLQTLFKFQSLSPKLLGLSLVAGLVCIIWFELLKKLLYSR